MTPKPQNFRLNTTDEKNINTIIKKVGVTTKVGAIRFALTLAVNNFKGAK